MPKRKKIPTIITDFDDCCVDFLGFLCDLYNAKHGTFLCESDMKSWGFKDLNLTDARGNVVTGEQLYNFFKEFEPHFYAAIPVIPDSMHALKYAKMLGYKIIILTARDEAFAKATEVSILRNRIPCDQIIYNWDKAKIVDELSKTHDIHFFVDDKMDSVRPIKERGKVRNAFLMSRTHNKDEVLDDEITRISSMLEIIRNMKEIKVEHK